MTTTRVSRTIAAPAAAVYRALLDPVAVQRWMVPDDMTSAVHEFDARVGGRFRISLTYDDPARAGKTEGATDSFAGTFAELVPNERVVQRLAFETGDTDLGAAMTITYELRDAAAPDGDGQPATLVTGIHEGLPEGVSAADNELGWTMSLAKLAALVEAP